MQLYHPMILFCLRVKCTGENGKKYVLCVLKKAMTPDSTDIRQLIGNQEARHEQLFYVHQIEPLPLAPDREITYHGFNLNLTKLSCTCGESVQKRELYGEGRDLRVLCKHLHQKLRKYFAAGSLTMVLAEQQRKYGSEMLLQREVHGRNVYFGFAADAYPPEWISVYLPGKTNEVKYVRFAYSLRGRRWAYGLPPDESKVIESYLSLLFEKSSRFKKGFSITI